MDLKASIGTWTGTTGKLFDQLGSIVLPDTLTGQSLCSSQALVHPNWDDSVQQNLIHTHTSTLNHFSEYESSKCIQSSHISSVSLSDIASARGASTGQDLVMKIIQIKQISEGLDASYTGDSLTVERAFQCGSIPASVYVKMLQRQDIMRTAGSLSLCEPEEECKPSEVNGLILRCLSKNESLDSGRKINLLRSECEGGTLLVSDDCSGDLHNNNKLRVDVAVQCDLMSSSSTLIVLGHQQQFMGLVLPLSGETVSNSLQCNHQITTSEFTSELFCNRGKIAAFYIPESSEVIDINSAVKNGLIDSWTADIVRSVEFPDAIPDVDHLHEMFSSWLIYKKLSVDGWHHSVAVPDLTSPSPSEAEQLFISYLMINSYVDPRSAQRVLILDSQSQTFLQNFPHFAFNSSFDTEQADVELLLVKEEIEEVMEDAQDPFDPCDFTSKINGSITPEENSPSEPELNNLACLDNKALGSEETTVTYVQAMKQDYIYELRQVYGMEPDAKVEATVHFNLDETEGRKSLEYDTREADSDSLDDPAILETPVPPFVCSVKSRNADSPFDYESASKFHHEKLPNCNSEFLCRESTSVDLNQSYFLCFSETIRGEKKFNYPLQVNKDQMEEEGNLTVPLGPLKNLVAVQTVPELNNMLSDENICALGLSEETLLDLKQTDMYQTEEESSLKSDCNISFSNALEFGLGETKPVALEIKTCSYSRENLNSDTFEGHTVSSIQMYGAKNMQLPMKRGVAVMVLDLPNEEDNKDTEKAVKEGNVGTISNHTHCGHEAEMISSSSLIHVPADFVSHTDKLPLMAKDCDSQVSFNRQLTGATDVHSIIKENTAPIKETGLSGLRGISVDSENQPQHACVAFCSAESKRQPIDELFSAGYDSRKGSHAFSESELGTSGSLHNDLSLETERDTNNVCSDLNSEPAQSLHHLSSWNLVESAFISTSKDGGISEIKHAEDSSRYASPQPAVLHLRDDFSAESQPLCSQISFLYDRPAQQSSSSSQITVLFSDITTRNTPSQGCDVEDPLMTNNNVLEPNSCGENQMNVEIYKERLSPEKQHDDTFMVTNDAEELTVSKQEKNYVNVCCLKESCEISNIHLRQPEIEELGSGTQSEKGADLSNSIGSSVCCSSQSYKAVKVLVDEPEEIEQTEDNLQPTEKNSFQGLCEHTTPDVLMDMLNENTLSPNSSDIRGSELTCEEDEACKIKKQDDPLNIQQQLLQLFETVSLSQDFSMLQEMVESLSSALGGDTQEDQICMLESIKEESSEGEDEELAREASGICEVVESSHQPSTREFDSLDAYKAEEVKTEVQFSC
ncbi:hypothetical protein XENOCAPTIV_024177 [Xenoophorus captivus]|uniref:Uncharacterized protein n=1 Tax=Xenoophorus captivus TaxID=1517983 RepID=A0ABV0QCR5_9TELE